MAGYTASNVLEGTFHTFYIEDFADLPADAQLIDVRTPDEYALGTIGQAVNIPLDSLRDHLDELDSNRKLYIFCQIGLRGYLAERILAQHGFNCVNLSGGYRLYAAWQNDLQAIGVETRQYEYCGKEKKSST